MTHSWKMEVGTTAMAHFETRSISQEEIEDEDEDEDDQREVVREREKETSPICRSRGFDEVPHPSCVHRGVPLEQATLTRVRPTCFCFGSRAHSVQ
jgi:hypothetical protein